VRTLPAIGAPTYYGRPALKASHYRFLIITYFFIGGLAGAAQVIATIADLFGGRSDLAIVRAGRYLALGGAVVSPVLLILDLQVRERWLNMLRIFRATSPMSVGAWVLTAFGAFSGLAATGALLDQALGLRWARGAARLAGIPAAATGGVMTYYTGALLGASSTPLWAAAYRVLPPLFAASSAATATAAIALLLPRAAPSTAPRRIRRLALVATGVELACSLAVASTWERERVVAPLQQPGLRVLHRFSSMGMILPLVVHAMQEVTGRESHLFSAMASLVTLIGGFCLRTLVVLAGNASVDDPALYFGRTQPGEEAAR
jgi:formate-dependent nitrite reductase membrane component NrfD